jgi:hypothetical protein
LISSVTSNTGRKERREHLKMKFRGESAGEPLSTLEILPKQSALLFVGFLHQGGGKYTPNKGQKWKMEEKRKREWRYWRGRGGGERGRRGERGEGGKGRERGEGKTSVS